MGSDSDDIVSLPSPPPPRPAARREAIDAALRKFDGIEEVPAGWPSRERPRRIQWATLHRRPAGALVAAAVIAVVAIPAMQIALRDPPPDAASEEVVPRVVQPGRGSSRPVTPTEVGQPSPAAAAAEEAPPRPQAPATPPAGNEDRRDFVAAEREEKARAVAPPPVMAAPAAPPMLAAPPPPPPPPAEPQAEADEAGSIVVTGSRVRRSNLESAVPVTVIGTFDDFLSRLQGALRANDRRAVIRLIGFPLKVSVGGESRTYRSSREVERNYDRIFTPEVREAALSLSSEDLQTRDGGRLKGYGSIWFGCGLPSCSPNATIRIREINP